LNGEECAALLAGLDTAVRSEAGRSLDLAALAQGHRSVRVRNVLRCSDAFDRLIDHPKTLPYLLRFLGPYVRLLGSEAFVRGAAPSPTVLFHTDGGPALGQLPFNPHGIAVQAKIQFFLTDVTLPDSGNFMVVDGSHVRTGGTDVESVFVREVNEQLVGGAMPTDAKQIVARAGDAVLFPWCLWHAVAPNLRGTPRKSVILRYGQMWCQPFDLELSEAMLARLTPRRRRMVGDLGGRTDARAFYKPEDQLRIMGAR
jgi:hypothetical protein